jgi:hypothetical protein
MLLQRSREVKREREATSERGIGDAVTYSFSSQAKKVQDALDDVSWPQSPE